MNSTLKKTTVYSISDEALPELLTMLTNSMQTGQPIAVKAAEAVLNKYQAEQSVAYELVPHKTHQAPATIPEPPTQSAVEPYELCIPRRAGGARGGGIPGRRWELSHAAPDRDYLVLQREGDTFPTISTDLLTKVVPGSRFPALGTSRSVFIAVAGSEIWISLIDACEIYSGGLRNALKIFDVQEELSTIMFLDLPAPEGSRKRPRTLRRMLNLTAFTLWLRAELRANDGKHTKMLTSLVNVIDTIKSTLTAMSPVLEEVFRYEPGIESLEASVNDR